MGFFRPDVVLVTGHFDGQQYVKWPHLCPVKSCAIARFLVRKRRRNVLRLGHTGTADYGSDAASSRGYISGTDVAPTGTNRILADHPSTS